MNSLRIVFLIAVCFFRWAAFAGGELASLRDPSSLKNIENPCGTTKLTQWEIGFKDKSLVRTQVRSFDDSFCEPEKALPGQFNARAIFMDSNRKVLWERLILVSDRLHFDEMGAKGNFSGGVVQQETTMIQLKIPWNEISRSVRWLLIRTNAGIEYGPTAF